MKTNVKIKVTPRQSEKVQQICFNNNIGCVTTGKIIEKDIKYIFISSRGMSTTNSLKIFHGDSSEEVDADLFIRTNGTCEEDIELLKFEPYGFETPIFKCKLFEKNEEH